jgi:hypothetical protein
MVENIAADRRLLPQVQQAVRDLEPALLQLVQSDPRFFNDKQHPTRQFLAEITERSLAWSSAAAPGFADFFEPLRQAVDALAALPIGNAESFEFALHSLKQAWGEQEERNRHQRARAARILVKAEKRNLMAERITGDMKSRPDMSTAPGEIRRFITGPWSQVMAAAHLADTQPISAQSPTNLPAAGLLPGVWADVFINGAWSRWQLAWASPHALLFMFTDGSGKYKSMTRSMLDKMVGLGALRVMSQTVLEGALDAVAQKALRNSMDNAT